MSSLGRAIVVFLRFVVSSVGRTIVVQLYYLQFTSFLFALQLLLRIVPCFIVIRTLGDKRVICLYRSYVLVT